MEDHPYRPLYIDGPLSSVCTADVPPAPAPTPAAAPPAAAQPERPAAAVALLARRAQRSASDPQPWPSWAPACTTAVPRHLRPIVKVVERIEVDRIMSAAMPCDLVPDVDDPAVELALMLFEG